MDSRGNTLILQHFFLVISDAELRKTWRHSAAQFIILYNASEVNVVWTCLMLAKVSHYCEWNIMNQVALDGTAHAYRADVTCWMSVFCSFFLISYLLYVIQGLYSTFIDLCACFYIFSIISNFSVWCNIPVLLTKPEVDRPTVTVVVKTKL